MGCLRPRSPTSPTPCLSLPTLECPPHPDMCHPCVCVPRSEPRPRWQRGPCSSFALWFWALGWGSGVGVWLSARAGLLVPCVGPFPLSPSCFPVALQVLHHLRRRMPRPRRSDLHSLSRWLWAGVWVWPGSCLSARAYSFFVRYCPSPPPSHTCHPFVSAQVQTSSPLRGPCCFFVLWFWGLNWGCGWGFCVSACSSASALRAPLPHVPSCLLSAASGSLPSSSEDAAAL